MARIPRAVGIDLPATALFRADALVKSAAPRPTQKKYAAVAWISLIGVLLPPRELSLVVGVNFTPGRICLILLLFPALHALFSKGYRLLTPDIFAFGTALWIVIASAYSKGPEALLSAAGGESLEFLGAYLVGRAFFKTEPALQTFISVLKKLTIVLLLLAIADRISGRWITQDTLASLMNVVQPGANYRDGVIRAIATLDHPILLGAFFALTSAIFIYAGGSLLRRSSYVVACLLGCFLALSSASLMSWAMIVGLYSYDRIFKAFRWRWAVFWAIIVLVFCVILAVTNAPLGWVITHLTLDPESGYFRYLIWNAAFDRIAVSPIIGFSFDSLNNSILDYSVDCVWLAYALRFGLPMIGFLFLANLTAIWPSGKGRSGIHGTTFMTRLNTGFTVVILMFMFIGLTVHFWNFIWIFWGLCLGIQVALKQQLAR